MLKFIRKRADSPWVKYGIFGVLAFVFILWGVGGGGIRGEKAEGVARVNGQVISPTELERTYTSLVDAYRNAYKDAFSPEMIEALNLRQRALDELVRVSLMEQEAQRIGLMTTDDEVRDSIRGVPAFQGTAGFDREQYQRVLHATRISATDFEEQQRRELLVRKMQALVADGAHISDEEAHQQFLYDNEKVILRAVKISAGDFMPQAQASDEDITAYYQSHQETYREPERVRVELATYAAAMFMGSVTFEDSEIQDYYQDHAADFDTPEQIRARHILIKLAPGADAATRDAKHKEAEAALARVKGGEDFAAVASAVSEDEGSKEKGGDLGLFGHNEMVKPFEDTAFTLEPGAISDIVETQFGFHVIKVEEHHKAETKPVEAVRDQIIEKLRLEKADQVRRDRAGADIESARGGKDFAEVARESGASVEATDALARDDSIPNVGRNKELSAGFFETDEGQVGGTVDTPNATYSFRVVEKIPSRIRDLNEVHDAVAEAVRKQGAEKLAQDRATALLERLKQNPDLEAMAQTESLAVIETGPFSRHDSTIPNLGSQPELRADAFGLRADHPTATKVYAIGPDRVLAALKDRVPAEESKFAEQQETIKKQYRTQRQRSAIDAFVNELKTRASIDIKPEYLDALQANPASRRRRL